MNDTPHDPETDEFDDLNGIDPADEADAEAGLNSDPAHTGVGMDNLDALIDERDQWKDRALRAVAEVENIKRRAETQNNDARAYAIQRFARDLLGVADNLERALQAAPKDAEGAAAGLVTGLELTQKSLLSAFASNNLVRVAPEAGEAFDPHLHHNFRLGRQHIVQRTRRSRRLCAVRVDLFCQHVVFERRTGKQHC